MPALRADPVRGLPRPRGGNIGPAREAITTLATVPDADAVPLHRGARAPRALVFPPLNLGDAGPLLPDGRPAPGPEPKTVGLLLTRHRSFS